MQLHAVDAEGTPPYPRGSHKARRLPNLTRMEDFEQRRVHKQGFRLAHQLGEDLPPQGLQVTSELSHPPMERGRVQPHHPGKQVREEPLSVAQERAFALHAPQSLEECEGDDFRVGEPLYGLVVFSAGVEMDISVVHETEEDGKGLFRLGEAWGMVG